MIQGLKEPAGLVAQYSTEPKDRLLGAWYREPNDDGMKKTDDLSITFHIVSYLGKRAGLAKIIATTLAMKDKSILLVGLKEAGT